MIKSRIAIMMAATATLALTGCATTSDGPSKPTNGVGGESVDASTTKPGKIVCHTGELLKELEGIQVEIAEAEDRRAAVLENRQALEMVALKGGNPKSDYEPYNVLACRTTEVMARALLVEIPPGPEEPDPYIAAEKAVEDVAELCKSPQANQTQCSAVLDYFGAVLFARRAVNQLEAMTDTDAGGVDFVKIKELTEGLEMNVSQNWAQAMTKAAANPAAPKVDGGQEFPVTSQTLKDSLYALTCRTSFAVDTLVSVADQQDDSFGNEGSMLIASMSRGSGLGASEGCDDPAKSTVTQMFCHNRVVSEKCENPDNAPGVGGSK